MENQTSIAVVFALVVMLIPVAIAINAHNQTNTALADENARIDNLVPSGYWPLDENGGLIAYDHSGNGNNGTLMNGAAWLAAWDWHVKFGSSSVDFDGIDDYIYVPATDSLDFENAMTVMAWVAFEWSGGDLGIASMGGSIDEWPSWQLLYSEDSGRIAFKFGEADGYVESISAIVEYRWYHVAVTFENYRVKLYVDGMLQDVAEHYAVVPPMNGIMHIGADYFDRNPGAFMSGWIDDVQVFDHALSSSQVAGYARQGGNFERILLYTLREEDSVLEVNNWETGDVLFWIEGNGILHVISGIRMEAGASLEVAEGGGYVNVNKRRIVTLSADNVNNNAVANTLQNCGNLSFSVTAGTVYRFYALIMYTSAATSTGSRWTINGPANPTLLAYTSRYFLTATTQTLNYATAYQIPAASNATSATAGNIAIIEGIITPSANGTLAIRFASKIANSAITAKAGSTLEWW